MKRPLRDHTCTACTALESELRARFSAKRVSQDYLFLGWIVTCAVSINGREHRESPVGFYSATITQAVAVALFKLNAIPKRATHHDAAVVWASRDMRPKTARHKLVLHPVYAR